MSLPLDSDTSEDSFSDSKIGRRMDLALCEYFLIRLLRYLDFYIHRQLTFHLLRDFLYLFLKIWGISLNVIK